MFLRLPQLFLFVTASLFLGCATVAPPAAKPEPLVTPATPEATPLQPEAAKPLKVIAVGDMMLDGTARPVLQANGYDYPFAAVRRFFL